MGRKEKGRGRERKGRHDQFLSVHPFKETCACCSVSAREHYIDTDRRSVVALHSVPLPVPRRDWASPVPLNTVEHVGTEHMHLRTQLSTQVCLISLIRHSSVHSHFFRTYIVVSTLHIMTLQCSSALSQVWSKRILSAVFLRTVALCLGMQQTPSSAEKIRVTHNRYLWIGRMCVHITQLALV